MKKASVCLLFLLLALCLAWSVSAKERVVEDFDHFTDASTMDERVHPWEDGGTLKLSLTDKHAASGKALKVVPGGGVYTYIIFEIPEDQRDWTGMEYLRFHVASTGGTVKDPTYVGLSVQINDFSDDSNGMGERWHGAANRVYYVIHDDGTEETRRFSDNGIVVDDGASFWVEIPVKSFDSYGWSMIDDELQLTNINQLFFALDPDFFKNKDLYIDSVSIVGDKLVDPAPPTQATTTTTATTTATNKATTTAANKAPTTTKGATTAKGSQAGNKTTTTAAEASEPSDVPDPTETDSTGDVTEPITDMTEPDIDGTDAEGEPTVPASDNTPKDPGADENKGSNAWIWWVVGAVVVVAAGAGAAVYLVRSRKPKVS